MFEEEDAFLVANDDVREFFVRDRSGDNLGADARIVVDEIGNELCLAFGGTNEFEPVENSGIVRFGITAMRAMSPEAFAGDNVFEAVAVHVD